MSAARTPTPIADGPCCAAFSNPPAASAPGDQSERARAARTVRSLGDLNGLELVVKIGIDKDRDNPSSEGRNVIAAAIGP